MWPPTRRQVRAHPAACPRAESAPAGPLTRPPDRTGTRASQSGLTARIVSTAARWVYEGKRLDMQGLADEAGVSRATLFRHAGTREELLSKALWVLTERMLTAAAERWEAERPEGELHTPGTVRHINAMVATSPGLRRLLDDEPALAMRVLTDPRGRVQSGIVAFVADLLRRDMDEFGFVPAIDPEALAFALVRLGESVLRRCAGRPPARRRHRQPAAAGAGRGHPAVNQPRGAHGRMPGCLSRPRSAAGRAGELPSPCTWTTGSGGPRLPPGAHRGHGRCRRRCRGA